MIRGYILLFLILMSCTRSKHEFCFRFEKNYSGDNLSKQKTGLLWALSYLGASLPAGSFEKALHWKDSSTCSIQFEKLGFSESAISCIRQICDSIKNSKEYFLHGSADPGMFVALTIGSSWHYYKLTGVPANMKDFFSLAPKELKLFKLQHSTVAKHQRQIRYNISGTDPTKWVFIAEEGEMDIEGFSFKISAYEVFNIMANGQLRFGIYDAEGKLMSSSPKHLGEAGKPGKCLWCHEISIQPLFVQNNSEEGSVSPEEFVNDVKTAMDRLMSFRKKLKSEIDFEKTQDHTQMELLYISYMQPSADKLMKEWNISKKEVNALTAALEAKDHEEFKFLGKLFERSSFSSGISLPGNVREASNSEPDYFGMNPE